MEGKINLKWTTHKATVIAMFDTLLSTESLVDVTLACDGKLIRAHKVVLSACSPYFQEIFGIGEAGNKTPILYLRGVKYAELEALVHYMYRGEVSVSHDQLQSILELAKELKIRGLSDVSPETSPTDTRNNIYDELLNSRVELDTFLTEPTAVDIAPLPPPDSSSANAIPSSNFHGETRKRTDVQRQRQKTQFVPDEPAASRVQKRFKQSNTELSIPRLPHNTVQDSPGRFGQIPGLTSMENLQLFADTFYARRKAAALQNLEGLDSEPEVVEPNDCKPATDTDNWTSSKGNPRALFSSNTNTSTDGNGDINSVPIAAVQEGLASEYPDDADPIYNRQKRSGVWLHFTTVPSDEDESELCSQCNYCDKKYKRSTSTTNMKCHLNVNHQIFF